MLKKANYFLFIVLSVFVMCRESQASNITTVPNIMSAPVVLYDEANNILADGDYRVTIGFTDISGSLLYTEEQEVVVSNGVAMISVGQGSAVGSDLATPAGGLAWDVFGVQSDITVQILVEGQTSAQEIAVLTTQPYSFIAQRAITVSDDAITSDKIMDGTITAADLDEGLYQSLLNGGTDEDGNPTSQDTTTVVNAKDVDVSSSIGLNNASGTNVQDILKGLDTAIDMLRGTDLDQGLENVQTDMTAVNNAIATLDATYATDADVTVLRTTVNNLDSTYATDADLSSVNSSLNSLASTVATNSSNISTLQTDVSNLELRVGTLEADRTITEDEIPQPIKPFAYGSASISGSGAVGTCTGYNINTSVTGKCQFVNAAASTNYYVQLTPSAPYLCYPSDGSATSVAYSLYSKKTSASYFEMYSNCASVGTSPSKVDFIVFSNQ